MATLANKASAPLDTVYAWVTSDLETSFSDFSLSTTFPRRELDTEPKSASLKELQLAPSATILVMPKVRSLPLQCVEHSLLPKGQNFFNNPCPIVIMVTW